jgi:hypothetical protein
MDKIVGYSDFDYSEMLCSAQLWLKSKSWNSYNIFDKMAAKMNKNVGK